MYASISHLLPSTLGNSVYYIYLPVPNRVSLLSNHFHVESAHRPQLSPPQTLQYRGALSPSRTPIRNAQSQRPMSTVFRAYIWLGSIILVRALVMARNQKYTTYAKTGFNACHQVPARASCVLRSLECGKAQPITCSSAARLQPFLVWSNRSVSGECSAFVRRVHDIAFLPFLRRGHFTFVCGSPTQTQHKSCIVLPEGECAATIMIIFWCPFFQHAHI